jgi:hypothetical protein
MCHFYLDTAFFSEGPHKTFLTVVSVADKITFLCSCSVDRNLGTRSDGKPDQSIRSMYSKIVNM